MKKIQFILVLCAFLVPSFAVYAADDQGSKPSIEIHAPYAFATTPNSPTGAAFFTIINNGDQDDVLTGAKSDVADITEIHQNYIDEDDGTMSMRKILSVAVPAGGQAVLKPTGKHIMLIKLKKQLRLEDSFPLTLIFEEAGSVPVNVNIIPPGTQPIEALKNLQDKVGEIILKIDEADSQPQATGEAVNLLKPLVPEGFGQQKIEAEAQRINARQIERVLLEDGSDYEEDINLENLDIENFE